jgi:hypothetical protein
MPKKVMCQSILHFIQIIMKVEKMARIYLCPKVNYGPQSDDFYKTHNSLMLSVGDFVIFNISQSVEGVYKVIVEIHLCSLVKYDYQ